MAAKKKNLVRIGIYYDGYFFYKVSNYYKFDHSRQSRISIQGFHNFICNEVSSKLAVDVDNCKIVEAHYFRGRSNKAGNEKAIIGERYFEDALTREGVDLHYLPLIRGNNKELKEKGIDVSLALDAYKKAVSKSFDIFVLVAGDGDYLPLVRELQTMVGAIDVMLASWDFDNGGGDITMTSQDLLEEVKYPLQMSNIIDDRLNLKNPIINGIFEPVSANPGNFQTPYGAPTGNIPNNVVNGAPNNFTVAMPYNGYKRKMLSDEEMSQERISTILSLDKVGGWIKDIEYNNFYFFYSDIENKKPEELTIGMSLQFQLEFDRIKTQQKDNGEPSYRALGPIYVVDL